MTREEKHSIALKRYAAVTPLVNGTLDAYQSKSSFYKEATLKPYPAEDGSMRRYSPATIEHWYRNYLKNGFDGLMPKGRNDMGKSRVLDGVCQEYIRHMKTQYPGIPAATLCRQMLSEEIITRNMVSESSVNRFVNHIMEEKKQTTNRDLRRYGRPHINEAWCGDSSVGPRLLSESSKKKVFITALTDDASRFITGADVFFKDTFVNLTSVMKSAVSRYGRPSKLPYFVHAARPLEPASCKSLIQHQPAVFLPHQSLDAVCTPAAKQIQGIRHIRGAACLCFEDCRKAVHSRTQVCISTHNVYGFKAYSIIEHYGPPPGHLTGAS